MPKCMCWSVHAAARTSCCPAATIGKAASLWGHYAQQRGSVIWRWATERLLLCAPYTTCNTLRALAKPTKAWLIQRGPPSACSITKCAIAQCRWQSWEELYTRAAAT